MITLGFKNNDRTLEGIGLEEAFKTLEDVIIHSPRYEDIGIEPGAIPFLPSAITCEIKSHGF